MGTRNDPAWQIDRPATHFGDSCPQLGPCWNSLAPAVKHISEDCLSLNIYAPPRRITPTYPVIVFIHAGGMKWGSSRDWENWGAPDGAGVAAVDKTIYITINYRTGVFGFLGGEALRSERNGGGSTGHYGVQDQREALRWVQKHIAAFGGDPTRVTLMGESAGATFVSLHLVTPPSWGLFARAVIESGAFNQWTRKSMANAQATFDRFAYAVGCGGKPSSLADQTKCLRAQPVQKLLDFSDADFGDVSLDRYARGSALPNASNACGLAPGEKPDLPHPDSMDTCLWSPPVDGIELLDLPENLLLKGQVVPEDVQILLGFNQDEGTYFNYIARNANDPASTFASKFAIPSFGNDLAPRITAQYPIDMTNRAVMGTGAHALPKWAHYPPFGEPWFAESRAIGDYTIACPSYRAANLLARNGRDVFVYFFTPTPTRSINMNTSDLAFKGSFHGAEVPFVFYDEWELDSPGEKALGKQMVAHWAAFAGTGDPAVYGSAPLPWPRYKVGIGSTLKFAVSDDYSSAIVTIESNGVRGAFCTAVWDDINAAQLAMAAGSGGGADNDVIFALTWQVVVIVLTGGGVALLCCVALGVAVAFVALRVLRAQRQPSSTMSLNVSDAARLNAPLFAAVEDEYVVEDGGYALIAPVDGSSEVCV